MKSKQLLSIIAFCSLLLAKVSFLATGHTDLHHFFVISFIIVQIGIISTGISL